MSDGGYLAHIERKKSDSVVVANMVGKDLKEIKIKPSKKIKSTKLTNEESNAYDDAMTQYNGNEKKVVKDLEQEFPRLKKYKKWI